MRKFAPVLIFVLAVLGCTLLDENQSPDVVLAHLDGQFTALVEAASDQREAGLLTDGEIAVLDDLFERGNRILDEAWSSLRADNRSAVHRYAGALRTVILEIGLYVERDDDGT